MSSTFSYSPLSGNQCRFIQLTPPGNDGAALVQCSIVQAPLGSVPFMALSYTKPITIDGKVLHVTANLAACLSEFSRHSGITSTGRQTLL